MRANRDGKAVVPGDGGYDIEVIEVVGGPDRMMAMPPAKSRGRLIPMGDGEGLPERPSPLLRKKRSKTPLVPTRDEFVALPRWARVAFAARCARRVLPAFGFFWKEAPEHHLRAVERAVDVAEDAAVRYAYDDADARVYTGPYTHLDVVAASAARANADVAAFAARTASAVDINDVITATHFAARVLFEAATTDTPLTAQLRCIRRDFARLKRLAREQKWTDDTPVPPTVFGPMWPDGVAPYWAEPPAEKLP